MTHAVMCGNVYEDERGGCFVPWCTCWCHEKTDPTGGQISGDSGTSEGAR